MIPIDLRNKTALITGSTGQLGRVMAKTLASCGADVVLHYFKNRSKAEELQQEIQGLGRKCLLIASDITHFHEVLSMKEEALKRFNKLDILVVNAVVQYPWKKILEQPPEDYFHQFNSCVMQSVYLSKAFLPSMIENQSGRIIGINTECSMQCFSGQSAYVAGKRGMDGFFRVLAREAGEHGITVNQVAPGWTISDRDRENHTEKHAEYDRMVPLKRRGTDQEIANSVAFLASDLASFITGAFIPVCGGNVMPSI